jgi:S-adenosylmethionine:tRNA ribosyltransferase-isomerase
MNLGQLTFSDFSFPFDDDLMATHHRETDEIRLIIADCRTSTIQICSFSEIVHHLPEGTYTIWNDSLAEPSILSGWHESGRFIHICFLQEGNAPDQWEVIVFSVDTPEQSGSFSLAKGAATGRIDRKTGDFEAGYWVERGQFRGYRGLATMKQPPADLRRLLRTEGKLMHPWYTDLNKLDTGLLNPSFATTPGSVCPSLPSRRFTPEMLARLRLRDITQIFVSLAMNFSWNPSGADVELDEYSMNDEIFSVPEGAANGLNRAIALDRELVAVGTSAVRVVESLRYPVVRTRGRTSLFVRPGFRFQAVTGLVTNLHVPMSTHVIMAAAIGGYDLVMRALTKAAAQRLKFGIHGDALLILSGGRRISP